jgi:hypothetical protein
MLDLFLQVICQDLCQLQLRTQAVAFKGGECNRLLCSAHTKKGAEAPLLDLNNTRGNVLVLGVKSDCIDLGCLLFLCVCR